MAQPQQGGGQGGRRASLGFGGGWDGWAAPCPGAAGHLQELQVFLVTAPAPAPHPGCPTHHGQCHQYLDAEQEQKDDSELGPVWEKGVYALVGSGNEDGDWGTCMSASRPSCPQDAPWGL